jgi:hypothetical protein
MHEAKEKGTPQTMFIPWTTYVTMSDSDIEELFLMVRKLQAKGYRIGLKIETALSGHDGTIGINRIRRLTAKYRMPPHRTTIDGGPSNYEIFGRH